MHNPAVLHDSLQELADWLAQGKACRTRKLFITHHSAALLFSTPAAAE